MSQLHNAPLTMNRRYMRRLFERLVRTHYPHGTSLSGVRIYEVGKFQFKHSFRYDLTLKSPDGTRSTVAIRGNVPSSDRPYETLVAFRAQHALARHGFAFGPLRVPASFGIVPSLRLNLYEEFPGTTLEQLISRRDPRALRVAASAGTWLAKLHSTHLTTGPITTFDRMANDAAFFRDDVRRTAPQHIEPMVRTAYGVVNAQKDIVDHYAHYFCTTHGDLNLGNIVANDDDSIAFIDFGNSVVYDPISDVGNFLAQIDLLVWRRKCTPAQRTALTRVFTRAYQSAVHGVGPDIDVRLAIHHAWWTLQVLAYALSISKPLGRRIAPFATHNASALLARAGHAPLPALESSSDKDFKTVLMDSGAMHAFFQQRLPIMYPNHQKIERISVTHQSALSTTSFLMHYKLDIMRPNGVIDHKSIRGNFVDPATYRIMETVFHHSTSSYTAMHPLMFDARHHYEFYEEVPGVSLRNIPFRSPRFSKLIAPIARALADFHSVPSKGLRPLSWAIEKKAVDTSLTRISQQLPDYRRNIKDHVAILLRTERKLWNTNRAIVHNDFQASNIIIDGTTIGLIDFTLSATGNAAIDVGTFLSHLSVMLHGVLSPTHIERMRNTFLGAYLSHTAPSRRVSVRNAINVFELRSCVDILAITLINLGPKDKNRDVYRTLLQNRIESLILAITTRP